MYLLFTFIPRVWAKRWNLLIVALNISWAARNYFIISACSGGECPEKKSGIIYCPDLIIAYVTRSSVSENGSVIR